MRFIDIENKHVLVIDDFFDEKQLTSIKKEIAYLECDDKLLKPNSTGTASEKNNKPKKNKKDIHLRTITTGRISIDKFIWIFINIILKTVISSDRCYLETYCLSQTPYSKIIFINFFIP